MKLVFVASPYSTGNCLVNVHTAMDEADKLVKAGYLVFVPILSHYWEIRSPKPKHYWLNLDLAILPICDCLLRIPGDSEGADGEVSKARTLHIPIYFSAEELIAKER